MTHNRISAPQSLEQQKIAMEEEIAQAESAILQRSQQQQQQNGDSTKARDGIQLSCIIYPC